MDIQFILEVLKDDYGLYKLLLWFLEGLELLLNYRYVIQEMVIRLRSYLRLNRDTIKLIFHFQSYLLTLEMIKYYIKDHWIDNKIIFDILPSLK